MTVNEGRDVIDQKDVDAQVAAELLISRGQGGSAQLRERHCGMCGKTGYNVRTCQVVIEISEEGYSD